MTWLWVGLVCKREGREWEDGWGGPFPDFLVGQEASTPWSACTAAGQRHGGCSQTHYHTWREGGRKKNELFGFEQITLFCAFCFLFRLTLTSCFTCGTGRDIWKLTRKWAWRSCHWGRFRRQHQRWRSGCHRWSQKRPPADHKPHYKSDVSTLSFFNSDIITSHVSALQYMWNNFCVTWSSV